MAACGCQTLFLFLATILTFLDFALSMRCYVCSWNAVNCQDFNCYNNPDICTNNNFSPTIVRSVECPAGCESFVVTDPNGLVQQWRRNCDSSGDSYGQWRDPYPKCTTSYQLGLRITRCTCNDHLCNKAHSPHPPSLLSLTSLSVIITVCLVFIHL